MQWDLAGKESKKSASALFSLEQIRRSGIEGVLCLQFLSGLDPRGARRLRWTRKLSQKFYTFLSLNRKTETP
jgi:hypothetical protein